MTGKRPLQLAPTSKVRLDGDSTLHRFFAETQVLSAEGEIAPGPRITALTVRIPVRALRSDKEDLNRQMHRELKGDRFPEIVFTLAEPTAPRDGKLRMVGHLSLAGVSKDITLEARGESQDGELWLRGEQSLRMSDFAITPPKLLMGLLKTADEVTVTYELGLRVS